MASPLASMPTVDSFIAELLQAGQQHIVTLLVVLVWFGLLWPVRVVRRRLLPPPLTVYLSATLDDLGPYRAAVIAALDRLGARHHGDPKNAGQPSARLDDRLPRVRGCDLFIGLYAWRYGPTEVRIGKDGKADRRSVTDHELNEAVTKDVHRALWMVRKSAAWPVTDVDDPRTDILKLRHRVGADPSIRDLPRASMALSRQVEKAVVDRQRELHPQLQLLAELTAPSGLVLAIGMGVLAFAGQVLGDALSHTSSNRAFVACVALAAFAAAYGVRFLAVRLP